MAMPGFAGAAELFTTDGHRCTRIKRRDLATDEHRPQRTRKKGIFIGMEVMDENERSKTSFLSSSVCARLWLKIFSASFVSTDKRKDLATDEHRPQRTERKEFL
jgi:hypothetical protein